MTTGSYAPVIAAAIALFGLLLAGDVLSASGRIRRKLEKEINIWDKLPPGIAKHHLGLMIRRHTLQLSWQENRRSLVVARAVALVQVLLSAGVAIFALIFGLIYQRTHPAAAGSTQFTQWRVLLIVLGAGIALLLVQMILIDSIRRIWVNRHLALDRLPKGRRLGPTRRVRVQTPPARTANSWRRILQARRSRRARF